MVDSKTSICHREFKTRKSKKLSLRLTNLGQLRDQTIRNPQHVLEVRWKVSDLIDSKPGAGGLQYRFGFVGTSILGITPGQEYQTCRAIQRGIQE